MPHLALGSPPPSATSVLNLIATDTTERERIGLDWRLDDALGLNSAQVSVFQQDATPRQHTFEDRIGTDRIRDNQFNNEVFGFAAYAVKSLGDHRLTGGRAHQRLGRPVAGRGANRGAVTGGPLMDWAEEVQAGTLTTPDAIAKARELIGRATAAPTN